VNVSARTVVGEAGLITDYAADGRAIGIEITSPSIVTLPVFNTALAAAQQPPAAPDDIAPLLLGSRRSSATG
jgi:hypothetical protein